MRANQMTLIALALMLVASSLPQPQTADSSSLSHARVSEAGILGDLFGIVHDVVCTVVGLVGPDCGPVPGELPVDPTPDAPQMGDELVAIFGFPDQPLPGPPEAGVVITHNQDGKVRIDVVPYFRNADGVWALAPDGTQFRMYMLGCTTPPSCGDALQEYASVENGVAHFRFLVDDNPGPFQVQVEYHGHAEGQPDPNLRSVYFAPRNVALANMIDPSNPDQDVLNAASASEAPGEFAQSNHEIPQDDVNGITHDPGVNVPYTLLVVAPSGLGGGDGFVAAIGIPDVATAGASPLILVGAHNLFTVTAYVLGEGGHYSSMAGEQQLQLVLQVDCGPVGDAGTPLPCGSGPTDYTYEVRKPFTPSAAGTSIDVTGQDMQVLFAETPAGTLPLNGVHMWVEHADGTGQSNFAVPTEALLAAAAAAPDPAASDALLAAADVVDHNLWHPVLVLDGAGAPTPPGGVPPSGDGFVAAFELPSDPVLGVVPLLAGGAPFDVKVTLFTDAGAGFAAAPSGDYVLDLQVDCGDLAAVVDMAAPGTCAGGGDYTTRTKEYHFSSSSFTQSISAADQAELLGALPVTALHIFVGTWQGTHWAQSNFATPTALLLAAGDKDVAPIVDLIDDTLWNPVLLADASAVPSPPGAPPLGDGYFAYWGDMLDPVSAIADRQEPPLLLSFDDANTLHLAGTLYQAAEDGSPESSGPGNVVVSIELDCGLLHDLPTAALCDALGVDGTRVHKDADTCSDVVVLGAAAAACEPGSFDVHFTQRDLSPLAIALAAADGADVLGTLDALPVNVFVSHSGWPSDTFSHYNAAAQLLYTLTGGASFPVSDLLEDTTFTPLLIPVPDIVGNAAPDQVAHLTGTLREYEGFSIDLQWDQGVDHDGSIDHYDIQRAIDAGAFSHLADVAGDEQTPSYSDSNGLLQGHTYAYKVAAFDNEGLAGLASDSVSVPIAGSCAAPAQVTGLTATPIASDRIRVDWTAVSGATRYLLWRQVGTNTYALSDLPATPAQVTVHDLAPNTAYTFGVQAGSGSCTGPVSAFQTATTLAAQTTGTNGGSGGSGASGGSGGGSGNTNANPPATPPTTPPADPPVTPPADNPSPVTPPANTPPPVTPPHGPPTLQDVNEYNDAIGIEVSRDETAASNTVHWILPKQPPGPIAGVQVWRSNSPYTLVGTFPSDSAAFKQGTVSDSSPNAKSTTHYLVTVFFGATKDLGFFSASAAPDLSEHPGRPIITTSASLAPASKGSVASLSWLAVILVALLLVTVLVVVAQRAGKPRA